MERQRTGRASAEELAWIDWPSLVGEKPGNFVQVAELPCPLVFQFPKITTFSH